MNLNAADRALIAAMQEGVPLVSRPYLDIARRTGLTETMVIDRVHGLLRRGVISRFGVVVRHRALGYVHNAMVVWDVNDDSVDDTGERMARLDFVTLCYRRPRRLPHWPYNLFCMIHGRDRSVVEGQIHTLARLEGLETAPHETLFSRRCFKQRGARYATAANSSERDVGSRHREYA